MNLVPHLNVMYSQVEQFTQRLTVIVTHVFINNYVFDLRLRRLCILDFYISAIY